MTNKRLVNLWKRYNDLEKSCVREGPIGDLFDVLDTMAVAVLGNEDCWRRRELDRLGDAFEDILQVLEAFEAEMRRARARENRSQR